MNTISLCQKESFLKLGLYCNFQGQQYLFLSTVILISEKLYDSSVFVLYFFGNVKIVRTSRYSKDLII